MSGYRSGEEFYAPDYNPPGIDGYLGGPGGIPAQLKQTLQPGPNSVRNNVRVAAAKAEANGYIGAGIEVFVRAPNMQSSALVDFANTPRGSDLLNVPGRNGTIRAVTVFCADGVVHFDP